MSCVVAIRAIRIYAAPMADTGKTLRQLRLGTLQRVIVTRVDLDGAGLLIDRALLDAAGFHEGEKVDVYDVTSGARFSTFVVAAARGSGELALTGADAHLGHPGDLLDVVSWGFLKEKQARKHRPTLVRVDAQNRPLVAAPAPEAPPAKPREKEKPAEKPKAAPEGRVRSGSR